MILESVFNKSMCETKGFTKVSQILKEFDLKIQGLTLMTNLILK
jgi:hypothetical protein